MKPPVPTFDDIATAPSRAAELSMEELVHMMAKTAIVSAALASAQISATIEEPDQILLPEQAAALLGVSREAVLRNRKLPRLKGSTARKPRYSRRRLLEYLERGR